MRAVSARQKTLNNAIGWSYNLLSPEEQKIFVHLAVFSGGFTLEAAESVFWGTFTGKPVADLVASLVDKSLLQRRVEAGGEPRFHMLVTIKQFAMNCLRRTGDEGEARNRHLAYFLDLAERADREIHGPVQVGWIDAVESEQDNFRAALDWCVSAQNTQAGLRLLGALGWPWEVRGHYNEAHCWFDEIRVLPDVEHYPAAYARLLNHIGRHSWTQGDYREARCLLEESQAISLGLGAEGERILAEALNWLGLVAHFNEPDSDTAKTLFEGGLELYRKWGEARGMALSTFHLGIVESDQDNDSVALSMLEESLTMFRDLGDLFNIARVSVFLGYLFLKQEQYDRARMFFEQHLEIDEELQFWDGIADAWRDLGNLHRQQGEYGQASRLYEESLNVCGDHGLNPYGSLYLSGLLALYLDNYALASQRYTQLLDMGRRAEEKGGVGAVLVGLAAVAGGVKQPERAARLLGAGQSILEAYDYRVAPSDQAEFDRHIQIARDQIGEVVFEALEAEGRAMKMDQAMACALEG